MSFYTYLVDKEKSMFPYGPTGLWDKVCVWVLRNVYAARYWRESSLAAAAERETYCRGEIRRLEKKILRYMQAYIKVAELSDGESFCNGVCNPNQKDYPGEEINIDVGGAYFGMPDNDFLAKAEESSEAK